MPLTLSVISRRANVSAKYVKENSMGEKMSGLGYTKSVKGDYYRDVPMPQLVDSTWVYKAGSTPKTCKSTVEELVSLFQKQVEQVLPVAGTEKIAKAVNQGIFLLLRPTLKVKENVDEIRARFFRTVLVTDPLMMDYVKSMATSAGNDSEWLKDWASSEEEVEST